MIRPVLATFLACMISAGALAASPDDTATAKLPETPAEILALVLRQSIGAPARVEIGDQATARLAGDLIAIPRDPAIKMMTVTGRPFPADLALLVVGSEGMDAPGYVRFVPAGFIDADGALAWTTDDILASLNGTVMRRNAALVQQKRRPLEARRWALPPHYDPEKHQLTWAALILPKSEPSNSDGTVTYHAIGFGREGYVEITIVSSIEKAAAIGTMLDEFLDELNFRPGKSYGDALPTDRRAPNGLAGAMGIDSLHKANQEASFLSGDRVIPVAGGLVAAIGALSLLVYIRRHLRREARRV